MADHSTPPPLSSKVERRVSPDPLKLSMLAACKRGDLALITNCAHPGHKRNLGRVVRVLEPFDIGPWHRGACWLVEAVGTPLCGTDEHQFNAFERAHIPDAFLKPLTLDVESADEASQRSKPKKTRRVKPTPQELAADAPAWATADDLKLLDSLLVIAQDIAREANCHCGTLAEQVVVRRVLAVTRCCTSGHGRALVEDALIKCVATFQVES